MGFLDSKDFPSILDDDPDAFKDGWTKEEIEKLAKPKKEEIQSFSKKNFDIDLKLDEFHVWRWTLGSLPRKLL